MIFPRLLLLVMLSLCACSQEADQKEAQRPIRISLQQDLLSFDPMRTVDIFSEAILRCVYTSLYDFDDQLNLRPKLAKRHTRVDDRTWRIEIHDNVKFHDGSPLTADDVVFSIERARQGGRTEKLLEIVEQVELVDRTTFLLRAKEPYADFLSIFAKAETSIVSRKVVEAPGYTFTKPVGAGPFRVLSREENSRIQLERFDDYYLGKAASQYLDFVVLITEQERTAALLNGDVDILFSVSAYDCEKLRLSPHVKLLQAPSTKIEYLSLNNLHPPLDNPNVRRAISLAINRDNITGNVYHGYSEPAISLIPKGIIGYLDTPPVHNPEKARELLREAGLEKGFEFTVITIDTIRKNTLDYIRLDLADIGIRLNYNLVTMKKAAAMMQAGEHGGILVGWAFSSDPNSVLSVLLGSGSGKSMNSSNYSNPVVDTLLKSAREEPDREAKRQLYERINALVTEEAPIVILQNPMVLSAIRDTIGGVKFNHQGLIQYESMFRNKP